MGTYRPYASGAERFKEQFGYPLEAYRELTKSHPYLNAKGIGIIYHARKRGEQVEMTMDNRGTRLDVSQDLRTMMRGVMAPSIFESMLNNENQEPGDKVTMARFIPDSIDPCNAPEAVRPQSATERELIKEAAKEVTQDQRDRFKKRVKAQLEAIEKAKAAVRDARRFLAQQERALKNLRVDG